MALNQSEENIAKHHSERWFKGQLHKQKNLLLRIANMKKKLDKYCEFSMVPHFVWWVQYYPKWLYFV